MSKILLVEDNPNAVKRIIRYINKIFSELDVASFPDMGADEAAKKRINIQLNSLNESELRLVEGIIDAIIENRGTEGA